MVVKKIKTLFKWDLELFEVFGCKDGGNMVDDLVAALVLKNQTGKATIIKYDGMNDSQRKEAVRCIESVEPNPKS